MDSLPTRGVWSSLSALALLAAFSLPAVADDFHIDTKLYSDWDAEKGKSKAPPVESTTLFASGRVYDFLIRPPETIVFDPGQDLIVILDPNRQLKTQILTDEISTQISKLREAARNHKDEAVRDSAAAKFAESVDPKTGRLKLTNRWMQYEVETMAPDRPQVARQYAETADWLVQLNALLNPPMLPFPRLALNKVLRDRQELPVKITLTVTSEDRRHKPLVMHSEHTILMGLSQNDRLRIEAAGEQMHKFTEVQFDQYHRVEEEQAAAEGSKKR
jgi:hypothetical protein